MIFSHRSESVLGWFESENRNLTRFGAPLWQSTGDRCRRACPDPPYYLIGSYNAQVKRPAVPCGSLASPKAGGYTPIDPDDASRVATMPAVQRRPAHRADCSNAASSENQHQEVLKSKKTTSARAAASHTTHDCTASPDNCRRNGLRARQSRPLAAITLKDWPGVPPMLPCLHG